MFKIKKKFKILIFLILLNTNAYAENKVAYLDVDFILSQTNIGKSLFNKFKKNEDLKLNEFKVKEQKLKEEENKILASKNIISKEQLDVNIKEFQNKLKNYKNFKSDQINILKKTRKNQIIELLNSINPLIEKYMNENSISILIDKKNIFIANKNYDITNNLIELINKNIK